MQRRKNYFKLCGKIRGNQMQMTLNSEGKNNLNQKTKKNLLENLPVIV